MSKTINNEELSIGDFVVANTSSGMLYGICIGENLLFTSLGSKRITCLSQVYKITNMSDYDKSMYSRLGAQYNKAQQNYFDFKNKRAVAKKSFEIGDKGQDGFHGVYYLGKVRYEKPLVRETYKNSTWGGWTRTGREYIGNAKEETYNLYLYVAELRTYAKLPSANGDRSVELGNFAKSFTEEFKKNGKIDLDAETLVQNGIGLLFMKTASADTKGLNTAGGKTPCYAFLHISKSKIQIDDIVKKGAINFTHGDSVILDSRYDNDKITTKLDFI